MSPALSLRGLGFVWSLIAGIAAATLFTGPASAQNPPGRVALVIGNSAYQNVPFLPNPVNDAADIAMSFQRLGFTVRRVSNGTYDDMRRALLDFSQKARDAEMAVVYFAGHGIEVGGENWLVPIDAELKTDRDTEQEAISLRSVMLMVSSASKLGLVVLDACRNNPFLAKMRRTILSRSVTRGLSPVEPISNVLVAYAARDGTTAADGSGRNSPFTSALLMYMETPGLEINFLFRNVRDEVIAATRNEQQPFVYGSLSKEEIYLKPPVLRPAPPGPDDVAWALLKETTDEAALKRFVERYPTSPLRQQAEARIAALAAAQAAKPVPPRPDEVTWLLLKETTDEMALKRFVAQYPTSPLRPQAEARVAALAAAQAAKPVPPRPDEVTWLLLKDTTDQVALKRFMTQYPDSPLRPQAESRIAALAAAEAAKPKSPSPEDLAWNLLKNSKDADELRRFVEQFPNGTNRREAEQRIASLSTEQKASAPDERELARSLQFELKRVGCFDGAVDGEFNNTTKLALRNFAKLAGLTVPEGLVPDTLKAVRGIDKRVCPLVCATGERAEGDRCLRVSCPSGQVLKNGGCVAAAAANPSDHPANSAPSRSVQPAAPKSGGTGKCFNFQGRQFCE
jgi:Caspase domain